MFCYMPTCMSLPKDISHELLTIINSIGPGYVHTSQDEFEIAALSNL